MRVLLISANTETISMPVLPLGLACVAAATQNAGHEVALLNLMFEGDPMLSVRNTVENFRPHAVGISVRNIDDQNMLHPQFLLAPLREMVANCRSLSDAPIILGGAGYSIFPESALRYLGADMGIQGEGEVAFPRLLDRIGKGGQVSDLPGVRLPRGVNGGAVAAATHAPLRHFEDNLDDLLLPAPSLWVPRGARQCQLWVPVQSRRGCPLDCTYCSTSVIEGKSVRRRSPARIVQWLERLRETGSRDFNFVDNTFNLPPGFAKDLCRQIIQAQLDLRLWCIIYPKWIDAELVELMRRAGCCQISFGFESGSDRMLRSLNKQFNRDDVSAASRMFAEAGIERMGFLLLGGPGETKKSVEESLAFADSLGLELLKITTGLRIYPQTPLAETALAEGVIRPDDDLLFPRFYCAPELRDWLPERVAAYKASRTGVS